MREILFRGKRIDNGEWSYGSLIHRTEFYGDPCDDYLILTDGEFHCDYYTAEEVCNATVGQFTGLTDKNGKKIFEGDIVANAWERGVVSYGEFNCSCCDGVFGWSFGNADIREYDGYEVIGNIHDNPDLLNK